MSCDLSTNVVTVAVVVNMKFIEECKIFIKSFHEVKVYNQSINQFFNYRNVKTHFHMRKTQSSKI